VLGVVAGLEEGFNFFVVLLDVVLHFLRKSFQLFQIGLHGVRKIAELEGKQIRVGQAHHGGAAGLCESAAVNKIRIAKMRESLTLVGALPSRTEQ